MSDWWASAPVVSEKAAPAKPDDWWSDAPKVGPSVANLVASQIGVEPKPSLLSEAIKPITDIPSTYDRMVREARGDMSAGVSRMGEGGFGNIVKGAGQTALGAANYLGAPIAAPIHTIIGEPVKNATTYATGSEKAGDIAGTSAEIGASLFTPIPKGLKIGGAAKAEPLTIEQLDTVAKQGFESPEVKGLVFHPQTGPWLANEVRTHLSNEGSSVHLAPKTWGIISDLDHPPPNSTINGDGIKILRETLGQAARSADGQERRAATEAIRHIDDSIVNLPSWSVISGDPAKAAATWAKARSNYSAARHAETVAGKVEHAEDRAGATHSGANIDNLSRQEILKILGSDKAQRGFRQPEIDQMRLIVRGNATSNIPRTVGKALGGSGGFPMVLSAQAGAAAGAATHGLMGGIVGGTLPAVGYAMKKIGDTITKSRIDTLDKMIRSRAPASEEARLSMAQFGKASQAAQADPSAGNLARLFAVSASLSDALKQNDVDLSPHELFAAGAAAPKEEKKGIAASYVSGDKRYDYKGTGDFDHPDSWIATPHIPGP